MQEAGNQAPVLATIGSKSTTENVQLAFAISATDPDQTIPVLTASQLPAGASFVNNLNGSGSFTWTPTFVQAGVYNVIFVASDGSRADTEVVVINVGEAGNQRPVLAAIGARSVGENANLNFVVTATDPDATTPVLTASPIPAGATFTNNGNGTGTFNWTPTFAQEGIYTLNFVASDGSLADSEAVTITVFETNTPPVLTAIGARTVAEKALLTFTIAATDGQNDSLTFSTSTLPANATLTNDAGNNATFSWTPDSTQQGIYNISFFVNDPASARDTEVVTITVTRTNIPPVLVTIGNKSVSENAILSFGVSATDFDLDPLTLTTSVLPAGAVFTPSGPGSGIFSWTPTYAQAGVYPLTFRSTDSAFAVDSEVIQITVVDVDRAPALATIGSRGVTEGQLLSFRLAAADPDGDPITLSFAALPVGAAFVDSGNGSGSFVWTPSFVQSGVYSPVFLATANSLVDSEVVLISVTEAGNQTPLLTAIGPKTVSENVRLFFGVHATDAESVPVFVVQNAPPGSLFIDSGNGSGSFDWTPGFADAGSYQVRFIATDGTAADSEVVSITVTNFNQAPVLAPIGAQLADEGDTIRLHITATDADLSIPALLTFGLPAGSVFVDSANGSASFTWPVSYTQSGNYSTWFIATDGLAADSENVIFTINEAGNQAPVWVGVADTVITEGSVLVRTLVASDLDGPTLILSAATLPASATFVDSGNGRGRFTFAPSFLQAGLYPFTFYASDGLLSDTLSFLVAVSEAGDQAPVFDSIGTVLVNEGALLSLRVHARDPESTAVTLAASGLPPNASFVDSGNGVGGLVFSPSYLQAGLYVVNLLATDHGVPPLTRIQPVNITVADVNRPPVLDSIGPKLAVMEQAFGFNIRARDTTALPGNLIFLTTSALPSGATFVDSGNGRGRFSWTPTALQVGSYSVTFNAIDNGTPSLNDQEIVQISVLTANRAPVLTTIGPKFVTEGQTLQFTLTASDADGTTPVFSMVNYPPSASLVDQGNGTALFSYVPAFVEAGLRSVEFRASDGIVMDKEVVLIQVREAGNQPPTAQVQGPPSVFERDTLRATILANDPDSTHNPLSMISPLPGNATFVDSGNGRALFTFVPWFTQGGPYSLMFATSDGTFTDSVTYTFNVLDAGNQTPFLHALGNPALAIPDKVFREELQDSFYVAASDFDSTFARLRATNLPAGANFADYGNNTGRLAWKPGFSQAGVYQIVVFAKDAQDTTLYDSQLVSLTVNNFFPAPVWNPTIPKNHVVVEGAALNLNMAAIPIDTMPRFKANYKPANSTLTDNGNGTCNFNFHPSYFQAGLDSAVLIAYHPLDTSVQTPLVLRFTIPNTPQAPVWRPKNDTTVAENVQLILMITADDPDGTIPVVSGQNLPPGAVFDVPFQGGGSATARVTWRPAYNQQGVYSIRFLASDGVGVDTEIVQVTVVDGGNQRPLWTVKPTDASIILPGSYSIRVQAIDPDSTIPSLSVIGLPGQCHVRGFGQWRGPLPVQPRRQPGGPGVPGPVRGLRRHALGYGCRHLLRVQFHPRRRQPRRLDHVGRHHLPGELCVQGRTGAGSNSGRRRDHSGVINAADVIYLVNYIFKGGPPPPSLRR